jgi:hypothetical protein
MRSGYELDDLGSEFKPQQGQDFRPFHFVQTGSGYHLASYPVGNGDFPRGKSAGP